MFSSECHSLWRNDLGEPLYELFPGVILYGSIVRPELETVFDEACRAVAIDLEAVKQSVSVEADDDEVDPEKVFYSLEVSGEHVEQWNSTLNQARILMNEGKRL